MDVQFFLSERTKFIRYFYDTAAAPFTELKRKIDAREAPFDTSPYYEDDEPPFVDQWAEADRSLEILGRVCVSMLSASLQLYFETWEKELRVKGDPEARKKAFRKKGFLNAYKDTFEQVLKVSWDDCPADFAILEQVVLARHRDQHPDHIATMRVHHTYEDRKKYPSPFFASDLEKNLFPRGLPGGSLLSPAVDVSRDTLFEAITQVDNLATWLEERMQAAKYGT